MTSPMPIPNRSERPSASGSHDEHEDDHHGEHPAAPAGDDEPEVAATADPPDQRLHELATVEREAGQQVEHRRAAG